MKREFKMQSLEQKMEGCTKKKNDVRRKKINVPSGKRIAPDDLIEEGTSNCVQSTAPRRHRKTRTEGTDRENDIADESDLFMTTLKMRLWRHIVKGNYRKKEKIIAISMELTRDISHENQFYSRILW
ncbi:unnamed protein product [Nezara viridula]|uniref:Uncharacterized protein n=1 Tax=Nezara viridula TaxID=85310 RepID=A0A9P0E8W1_NEZVI|nr:unnamed protein product [Nezara viridula]